MKGLLISCLIFTLSLECFHSITAATVSASMRWPLVKPMARNIRSWCADTPKPRACFATIETSPRNDLKSTREGAALILVDAAKANVIPTTAAFTRLLQVDPAALNIESWCSGMPKPEVCVAKIQSDPRKDPKGAALILIDHAKANVRSTTAFLKENIKKKQEADVMGRLKGCLLGYDAMGDALDIDHARLDTRDGRSEVLEILSTWDGEITYDCGWQMLEHFPPVVKELDNRVSDFSNALGSAFHIISSIR